MKPGYSAGALLLCTTSFVSMPTSAQTTVDESAVQTTAPSTSVSPRSDPTRFASPRSRRMRAAPRGPGSGERQRRAPEAVAAEPDTDRTDEEITVTGSRIARSGVDSASPVTMVSSEELAKSSPSTLAAALNIARGQAAIRAGVAPENLIAAMHSEDLAFRLVGHFWTEPARLKLLYDELAASVGTGRDRRRRT